MLSYSWDWPLQSEGSEQEAYSTEAKAREAFNAKIAESRANDWLFDDNYAEGRWEERDDEKMSFYAGRKEQGDYIDIHVASMTLH